MTKLLSKFFRIAVEGQTTDGREITREQIVEMASSFNPEKYGARIWMEHFRGIFADGAFPAYGDVAALKAEEITEGDLKGKIGLYAQITPSPELIKINQAGQKIYTSIEMDTDFAGSKQAYLVGLGITDSPASLGTEALKFTAQHEEARKQLSIRKQNENNLFSSAELVSIELEAKAQSAADKTESASLFQKVKDLLGKSSKDQQDKFTGKLQDQDNAILALAQEVQALSAKLVPPDTMVLADFIQPEETEQLNGLIAELGEVKQQFKELVEKLSKEEPGSQRPPATGGNTVLADC